MTPETMIEACRLAVDKLPGCTLEERPSVEHLTIRLPIPGAVVQVRNNCGWPTMALRVDGKDRAWRNVPTVARSVEAGSRRIAREVRSLVLEAARRGPVPRDAQAGRMVPMRIGADVLEVLEDAAKARGMTVSGLIRRGIALAIAEKPGEDEARLRRAARLLVSASPAMRAKADTESGSWCHLARLVRRILRSEGRHQAPAGAKLLGIPWIGRAQK